MRDILKNLNDALEGPEVEYERWYGLWELFPLLFLRMNMHEKSLPPEQYNLKNFYSYACHREEEEEATG